MPETTSVLFVCLGNICRSPLAEGVFRHLVEERGLSERFVIDSAGTGAWHVGQPPDRRSVEVAEAHDIILTGRGRQVRAHDLRRFDVVVAMDRDNLEDLRDLAEATDGGARLHLLREFDPQADSPDVPDPYFDGASGFETVYQMVRRSCERLLDALAPADD